MVILNLKLEGRKAMRRGKTTIVGIVCGLVCAGSVFLYVQSVNSEAEAVRAEALARYGGEQLEVCVATQDIVAGEVVSSQAVEKQMWVADLLPTEAILDTKLVVGKTASSSIFSGEVITQHRFQEGLSSLEVPEGMHAVSVSAKEVQAVGGAISAGSYVDIYATGSSQTGLLAQNILVLETSTSASNDSSGDDISWITIAVDSSLVQEIVAATQTTELYFALPDAGLSQNLNNTEISNEEEEN